VIWVIGAEDQVEAQLAEDGYFDDANFIDQAPTQIVMIGSNLRPLCRGGGPLASLGADICGASPVIRSAGVNEWLFMNKLLGSVPDLVVAFMPDVPELGDAAPPKSPLAELPDGVVAAIEGTPIVITSRQGLNENNAMALRCKLRDQILLPQTRSPFSAKAGRPQAALDDNGWFYVVRGAGALAKATMMELHPAIGPPPGNSRLPALFWGILDIKYDVSKPVFDRVKVLETGNGRTSKFSGDGAAILKRFRERYTNDEDSADFHMYKVVSADKKLTHDLFERTGFEHLVPKQVCLPRKYSKTLAKTIHDALNVRGNDLIVLKLCNRSRAAGVLVTSAAELDKVLHDILIPPSDVDAWCQEHVARMRDGHPVDFGFGGCAFEEQKRHWWSNESPVFLAEQCCSSVPTIVDGASYDGTLRVAFALRRRADQPPSPPAQGDEPGLASHDLEIDWLGGYWKLPKSASSSRPSSMGGPSLRDLVVSAARTSGTATVRASHLHEVYTAVDDAVLELFGNTEPSPSALDQQHQDQPTLAAFFVARFGTACMVRQLGRTHKNLEEAQRLLNKANASENSESVMSYIDRSYGVIEARTGGGERWRRAEARFQKALEWQPTNANALYLLGMAALNDATVGSSERAVDFFSRSLLFDPDFRASYVNLAIGYLRLGQYESAVEVSDAGLARHPDAPQPHYHIGVAYCMLANDMLGKRGSESGAVGGFFGEPRESLGDLAGSGRQVRCSDRTTFEHFRSKAKLAFLRARGTDEARRRFRQKTDGVGQAEPPWLEVDCQMMESFDAEPEDCPKIKLPPNIGWTWTNFRT